MNTQKAIDDTWALAVARTHNADHEFNRVRPYIEHVSLGFEHLREMVERTRTEQMSDDKKSRWLGWMQAAVVCWGVASVDEMKGINRRHA